MTSPTPFGAPMKELFLTDPNFRNLNHGSFGTYPKAIQRVLHDYQTAAEARPDVFLRYTAPKAIDTARSAIAAFLNVPASECVLVKNATTGVNTVLRNLALSFTSQDALIYFDTVYGAVERTFLATCEASPLKHLRKVSYAFPISHDELLNRFRDVVRQTRDEGLVPRIAVFDTIVSNPGVRFPFERLIEVCRELGVLSLVDGAHGVGQIPLDLSVLRPDFFTSNCHKWLFVPRGCAVLYVPRRHQHLIRTTLPTSWGYIPAPAPPPPSDPSPSASEEEGGLTPSTLRPDPQKPAFVTLFEFVATSDDTPYMCIPAAFKFREEVCGGEDRIIAYLDQLAGQAAEVVAAALGTEVLAQPGVEAGRGEVGGCAMSNVLLPVKVIGTQTESEVKSGAVMRTGTRVWHVKSEDVQDLRQWIEDRLVEKGTFVPVFPHGGWLWTRLSAQVYLDRSDFEWLGDVLKGILGKLEESSVPLLSSYTVG